MTRRKTMFLGLVVIFIGLALLLERLDIIELRFGTYWPVLLIALGVTMIVNWWRKRE